MLQLVQNILEEDPGHLALLLSYPAISTRYGLIGRNGVGKSTLLRAMAERDGLGPPSIGRARRSQGTPVSVPCRTPFCRGRGGWVNPPAAGASVVLSRC